jgi:hypothetical protein
MTVRSVLTSFGVLLFIACVAGPTAARAQRMQSFQECVPGRRVVTSDGHNGTITRLDRAWSYCYVRQDDTGAEVSYLYSLLQTAGGGAGGAAAAGGASGNHLASGVYECFADGHYTFMDMRITGPSTYSAAGGPGRYHVDSSGKIVFETGSLKPYFSKIVSGGRIGLNTNGDPFYATTCELNPNKH